jgi:hypothetical protein
MPYTTLDKIKRRLNITTAEQDALLTDILNEVDAEINLMLSRYFQVPVQDTNLTTILSGIEADWVAGRFRAHVEPITLMTPEGEMREHAFVTDAKRRLRALVDSLQTTIKGV